MTTTPFVPVFSDTLAGQSSHLCNARDLHAALEVGRDFATWIKDRIEQYGFTDGEDFAIFNVPPIRGAGNRGKRTDYHLTLEMAKHLAMVENNERGREVRRYFIAVEKEARKATQAPRLTDDQAHLLRCIDLANAARIHLFAALSTCEEPMLDRFLVSIDETACVRKIDREAGVFKVSDLPRLLCDPEFPVTDAQLIDLIQVCASRLAHRKATTVLRRRSSPDRTAP